MPSIVSGPSGRSPTQYLFVDGAYLRSVLERKATRFFGGEAIEVDYHSLFVSGFNKRFYYDCLPPKKNNETRQDYDARIAPAIEHYNALRALDGFHVFLGTTASEGTKARQKGVDIMIAVHMLTHSFRGNMDKATLLTGDLDFKPLIEALVQDGMDVTLWFEPCSTSKELVYAADSQRELSITSLLPHTTPQFRQRHPVPNIWNQPGRKLDDFVLVQSGETSTGLHVDLFQGTGQFLLIVPDNSNVGNNLHIQHNDRSFIEKLMDERQATITWQS